MDTPTGDAGATASGTFRGGDSSGGGGGAAALAAPQAEWPSGRGTRAPPVRALTLRAARCAMCDVACRTLCAVLCARC